MSEYNQEAGAGVATQGEVQMHTWMDASLRELLDAAKGVVPALNKKDIRVAVFHVYQDTSGRFKRKEVAVIHSVKRANEDKITLSSFLFEIGDMLDFLAVPGSHHYQSTSNFVVGLFASQPTQKQGFRDSGKQGRDNSRGARHNGHYSSNFAFSRS